MELHIIKNMEPAPYLGSRFGQDVEPKGTYVIEKPPHFSASGSWVEGIAHINHPLIINVDDKTLISYKYELANKYKAKGQKLTNKLMAKGYDAIITKRDDNSTGEIILFPNCKFMLNKEKTMKNFIKNRLHEQLDEITKGVTYTAYHGTNADINNFSDEFVGGEKAVDQEGPGIYFTSLRKEAEMYGDKIYTVELSPRKLMDMTPLNKSKWKSFTAKMMQKAPNWKDTAQNFDINPYRGVSIAVESSLDINDTEKDLAQQIWIEFYRYSPVEFVRNMVKMGIDGIVVPRHEGNGNHVIIYNPAIIKKLD